MNKKLRLILEFLEGEIYGKQESRKFTNIPELEKISYSLSRCTYLYSWHIYFNSYELKDNTVLFNLNDNTNVISMSDITHFIEKLFTDIGEKANINPMYLKCLFNEYLINKYANKKGA